MVSNYTYGDSEWKDLLTAYDGESIVYDAIGNPTSYYNGERWTLGWTNGRQLTSLSKKPPVVITTQPENYYGSVGGNAIFTVAAEGDRLTYQWQRSTDDGTTWSNVSGGTTMTLRVPIQSSVNGNLYRCIVKDFMGHTATSQAGRLSVTSTVSTLSMFEPEYTIINEPDDYYGRIGDTATFIVEAEGANLSYNWLYCAPGSSNFEYMTSSDATTNTIRVEMTAENNGGEFRCFITDANGDMGSTRVATIKLDILDWEMEYNTSGVRTKRVSDEKTYDYIYAGDKLMRMMVGGDVLDFSYDTNGAPLTMTYNGTVYYYITNLQGDVVSVQTSTGSTVAEYAYDAWGNIIAMTGTLAERNPLRYRGYVYDQETGFYYVFSRYYDPEIGRWINSDTTDVLSLPYYHPGQYNLFAYCNNNPVNDRDDGGQLSWLAKIAIGSAAIAIGVGVTALTGGAALPAFIAGAKAACVAGAISAGAGAATTAISSAISGDNFSTVVKKSARAAVDKFADGFMSGGIAAGAAQVASGVFKIAANLGATTGKNGGIKIGNTKILSPDAAWHQNNGGTLLKVGDIFRIDVGSNTLFHIHLPGISSHIQIGTFIAGIFGWLK